MFLNINEKRIELVAPFFLFVHVTALLWKRGIYRKSFPPYPSPSFLKIFNSRYAAFVLTTLTSLARFYFYLFSATLTIVPILTLDNGKFYKNRDVFIFIY